MLQKEDDNNDVEMDDVQDDAMVDCLEIKCHRGNLVDESTKSVSS